MRKFSLIFTSLILMSALLIGCSTSLDNKDISLKKVDISVIKNNVLFNSTPEENLLRNIYLIQEKSKQYVLFYKVNVNDEGISCSIKDSVLEVNVETENDTENTYLYEIVDSKGDTYNTIKLIKDNKEVAFSSVVTN